MFIKLTIVFVHLPINLDVGLLFFRTKANIRCVLMEVLECYVRRWQNAPNDVTRFYCDSMADILAGMVI